MTLQLDLQFETPLVVAYGGGVDSTAMLIGFKQRSIRPDLILTADPGSEKDATYQYLPKINRWLEEASFPQVQIVRYRPQQFKYGPYRSLAGNCIRNATLPSLAFGRKACSMKWKVAPQHAFCATWKPAVRAWRSGRKVRKAIGFDSGVKDCMRYAEAAANAHDDSRYEYIYPLRNWGWDRDRCIREIIAASLSAPAKSACFCCPSTKPAELHDLEAW
jgi:hypothetical protein